MQPTATIVLCILVAAAGAAAQSVSPADRAALEGSTFTHYPLGRANLRMQTLHADVPAGATLSGHAYRADAIQLRGRVDTFAVDLEVSMSMSPRTPGQASSTFANNVGPAPVLVLPRTTVSFPATDRPGIDPAPGFAFAIPWQVPFLVPVQGGTVCLDTRVFGNFTPGGSNRNFSVYLDAHECRADGRNEQPGYRTGQGCPPPGRTALPYATFSLWHLGTGMQLDMAARNGVADDGSGQTRAFVAMGNTATADPWPGLPGCFLLSSTEVWWPMGNTDAQGAFTGSLPLPLLPPGHRVWLQSGSVHLLTGALAFGDASTLVTPPAGTVPIAAVRIANASDGAASTGTVNAAVPVTEFR